MCRVRHCETIEEDRVHRSRTLGIEFANPTLKAWYPWYHSSFPARASQDMSIIIYTPSPLGDDYGTASPPKQKEDESSERSFEIDNEREKDL